MARKIKIEFHSKAVAELLSSDEALEELSNRGERILDAANAAVPDAVEPFAMSAYVARGSSKMSRAMVKIRTATIEGRLAEAEHRTLEVSLDAGRG